MYVKVSEMEDIQAGLNLVYYGANLTEADRRIFEKALKAIESVKARYQEQKDGIVETKRTRRAIKRLHTETYEGKVKKYKLIMGGHVLYFNNPQEIADHFGIKLSAKKPEILEKKLRVALKTTDVRVTRYTSREIKRWQAEEYRKREAKEKEPCKSEESFGGVELPDLSKGE